MTRYNHSETVFELYTDHVPDYNQYSPMHAYFSATSHQEEAINLLVTMYDEDVQELQRTLVSIGHMIHHTRRKVRVLVIQDGWCRAHQSTKDYLRNMLFANSKKNWDELDTATNIALHRTYIIQPVDEYTGELEETWVSPSIRLPLSLLIKTDNRMKHNSHSWFFKAFCRDYPSTYLFLTDVGSTHHFQCLSRLEAFMDRNNGLAGCHGYPWIADPQPQSTWIQRYLRAMQEYELGPLATDHDRGFQSIFGFQQTLSGPCTMLRTEDAIYPSLLAFMSSVLERDPSLLNILSSNLIIVEDTAMTLYLFASSGKMLALVPDAYYYYDVETQPARFLTQRRRWMNGVGCGLLIFWRTYHKILKRSYHTRAIQVFVRALITIGICTQVLFPFVQPMLFSYVVFQAFNPSFCSAYPHTLRTFQEAALRPYAPYLSTAMASLYTGWFLLWTLFHALRTSSFHPTMFYITFFLAHTIGLYAYYLVLVITLQVAYQLLPVWQRPLGAFMIGTHYISPLLTTISKRDWRTLRVATLGLLPYITFFPMWSFIYSYNIARLWDVTWGNRTGVLDQQQYAEKYKRLSNRITVSYLLCMLLCIAGFSYSSLSYNASYLHAIYVVPWYLLSTAMGVTSIVWTLKYRVFTNTASVSVSASASGSDSPTFSGSIMRSPPSLFRQTTFKRLQRAFTFGADKSSYVI